LVDYLYLRQTAVVKQAVETARTSVSLGGNSSSYWCQQDGVFLPLKTGNPMNSRALSAFRHHVTGLWRRTLRRRSQKDGFTWDRMTRLVDAGFPSRASFILRQMYALTSDTQGRSRMP
jgi:hypothetical protein